MSNLKIFKETALPTPLEPNAMYLIAPPAKPNYVEVYVTSKTGAARRVVGEDDVIAICQGLSTQLFITADITERNTLNPTRNSFVLVKNAAADPTVGIGAALYIYDATAKTYSKIAEYESMDINFAWSNIVGGPTAAPTDIDSAVLVRHAHSNKAVIDKITADANGNIQYNGSHPLPGLVSENW